MAPVNIKTRTKRQWGWHSYRKSRHKKKSPEWYPGFEFAILADHFENVKFRLENDLAKMAAYGFAAGCAGAPASGAVTGCFTTFCKASLLWLARSREMPWLQMSAAL